MFNPSNSSEEQNNYKDEETSRFVDWRLFEKDPKVCLEAYYDDTHRCYGLLLTAYLKVKPAFTHLLGIDATYELIKGKEEGYVKSIASLLTKEWKNWHLTDQFVRLIASNKRTEVLLVFRLCFESQLDDDGKVPKILNEKIPAVQKLFTMLGLLTQKGLKHCKKLRATMRLKHKSG